MHTSRCALLALGFFLTPGSVEASGEYGRPLREYIRIAAYAFAGTVDSMRTVRLPNPDGSKGPVITLVHVSHLEVAKGDSLADTLTLRTYGGTLDGSMYGYGGQPELRVGARYVLLARKDLGSPPFFMPIVGSTRGIYPLQNDSIPGTPVVHDYEGRPIVAVSEGHIVVLERRMTRPPNHGVNPIPPSERTYDLLFRDEDTGRRMSESEFLSAIREFAKAELAK